MGRQSFFCPKNYLLIESNLLLEELLVGMLDILSLGLVKGVDLRHHRERQGVGSSAKKFFLTRPVTTGFKDWCNINLVGRLILFLYKCYGSDTCMY